jgi:hypothetical protein
LVERILDPTYLDGVANTFGGLKNVLQSSGTLAEAWVGEAGGAYSSGCHLVSDAFVNSFWLVYRNNPAIYRYISISSVVIQKSFFFFFLM